MVTTTVIQRGLSHGRPYVSKNAHVQCWRESGLSDFNQPIEFVCYFIEWVCNSSIRTTRSNRLITWRITSDYSAYVCMRRYSVCCTVRQKVFDACWFEYLDCRRNDWGIWVVEYDSFRVFFGWRPTSRMKTFVWSHDASLQLKWIDTRDSVAYYGDRFGADICFCFRDFSKTFIDFIRKIYLLLATLSVSVLYAYT